MEVLYSPQEVADSFGVARGTIYSLVSRGEIGSIKVGRSRRFTDQHIWDYVHRSVESVIDYTGR
jgi:excisionase family DNA binding protein